MPSQVPSTVPSTRWFSTLLLVSLLVPACAAAVYDYGQEPDPRKSEYVVGSSDRLKITVWKNPDLSGEALVRPDGTITVPLIGDLHAAGRTPTQLRADIAHRLAAYVKDESAVVTVAVVEANSYRFTVSGNVEHAGIFTSKYFVTVAEALALAGGLNKFGSPSSVVIVRNQPDHPVRRIPIDATRVSSGEHPEENLTLLPGDAVFVP